MNVLILAAGYATRLYPLTENKAKPLLELAGKPMIEWVLDNLAPIPDIRAVYVVTNDKFARDFETWAESYGKSQPKLTFKIVNDGSRSDAGAEGPGPGAPISPLANSPMGGDSAASSGGVRC